LDGRLLDGADLHAGAVSGAASIGAAIGTASLIAHLLEDRDAWPLGGFAVTTI
jgi:hypothetical protein